MTRRVVIIGAGPAGSLAAVLLARAGLAVTIVEQHRFPRDKVCGECLSALGQRVLARHELSGVLRESVRLCRAELNAGNARATLELPEPMVGLSRSVMDSAMLAEAAAAGAEVLQPARVESLIPDEKGVTVRVRRLAENVVEERFADVALIADGRGNFTGRKPAATKTLGIKAHFTGVAADAEAVTLYGGVNGYGGVAPIEHGKWNVAFAAPKSAISAVNGDIDQWWAGVRAASPALDRHFRDAIRVGPWLAAPLPRHCNTSDWPTNVIPIGAAGWAIEPVGGEGMGSALRLAELASAAIVAGETRSLPSAFATVMRQRGIFCRLGGWLLAGEHRSELLALAGQPVVGDIAMRLIGKSPATNAASPSAGPGRP